MPIAVSARGSGRDSSCRRVSVSYGYTRTGARPLVLRGLITLAALMAVLATATLAFSADRFGATTSRAARQHAVRAIPFDKLKPDDRATVRSILRRTTIYRRMPIKVIDCDPDMFTLLIRNPHIVANTWEVLGLSKLQMTRVDEGTYQADDGNGTRGTLRVLSENLGDEADNRLVLYGEGAYDGKPLLQPIRARCVMLLRSGSVLETNGRNYVTVRLDSFVQVEQMGLDLLARTIHPLLGKTADHNFVESMRFVGDFSRTAERNPTGIARLARRLRKVDHHTRGELVELAYDLAQRRRDRDPETTNDSPRAIKTVRHIGEAK